MLISHYHSSHPRIHLIMALYYLGKLFRYSVSLPRNIIYAEREFRALCYNICLKLQIANADYNMSRGLVRSNGYLAPCVYRCVSSPVIYERVVVPSDQCCFCKKRGYKNLGRHLFMAHGGQASAVGEARLEFD